MNSYKFKIRVLLYLLMLFCLLLQPNNEIYASDKAIITGKVIDTETGESLLGATVMLVGTQMGGRTDIKGVFKIKEIPAGIYTLRTSYVGYQAAELQNISITGNETKEIKIFVTPQSSKMEEVVVEARRINDNQAANLALRKNASEVSDGISAEEIKKLPDSDAGQSLKRVSGVTLVKDKFVFVRGLSERYSNTTLNGASLATTEPDKKAFAFDMFPADFLENANIAKSFTPDMPGNFVGGLVQLNTIDFPSEFSLKFNASASANDNVTFVENSFMSTHQNNTNWIGLNKGITDMPNDIPVSPVNMSQLLYKDLKSQDVNTKIKAQEKWSSLGSSFNNDVWKTENNAAPLNGNFSLAYTDIFSIAESDLGVIASVIYGNGYSLNTMERGVLESNGDYKTHGQGVQSTFSTNLGGVFNLSYKFSGHTSLSLKNIINNSSDNEIIVINGTRKGENMDIRQMSYDFVMKELYASQLTGEHLLPYKNSRIDWRLGYSQSLRDEPDFKRLRYSRFAGDTTQPFRIDIPESPQGNGISAGRFFSSLNENALNGSLNYIIPFKNLNLKLGGMYEQKKREFKVRSLTIVKSETLAKRYYDTTFQQDLENWTDDRILDLLNKDTNPADLFDSKNFYIHGLGLSEDSQTRDSYSAEENVTAMYIMADMPFLIGMNKLRIITGVRVESSLQTLDGYYPIFNEIDSSYSYQNFVNQSLVDFLPSLNVVYELTKTMNLRASASRTLTRPSLREFAPFTFYDFQTQVNVKGNPNLKRAIIQNYDLRYEWFMNSGEIFSVGGFYKVFDNAIEETILQASSEVFRSFGNAQGKAFNYGIEFELRKNLGFISSWLKNLSINTNLALINSEIVIKQNNAEDKRSMWGQSPYSFNLGLFYYKQEWGSTVNLAYNVIGRRIIQVADITSYQFDNPHVYELPRNFIDLSISQKLFEFLEIKFSAKDLLNEKLIWEQGGHLVASNLGGRSFSMSVGYKFN